MSPGSLQETPVAVIGQAAVFARSPDLRSYWENIVNKIDCITDVPEDRWKVDDYYHPDPQAEDKTYCKRGGFIPDIDFDPLEFGLPPNLLEVTDSSQLLGLVVARDAMEDAGYGTDREFDRSRTGVVLGVAGGQKLISDLSARLQYPIWRRVLISSGLSAEDTEMIIEKIKLAYAPWNENSFPGLLGNVIAGRIANRLDLGGINAVVDAACASSLAAVKMALSELLEGRADLMITGGVDTDNSPFTYLCFSKTPAFSPSQEIRPFDQSSDGMMIGEGLGMVILKRLEDAKRDGDRIYAVIRGIGSSSDGKFKSIYAPRPAGQSLAVQRAYQDADIDPRSIGLLEAHGTGTKAGDPAEITGLNAVFGPPNGKGQTIAVGSVKSQIGHTKAAAGAAGMIKTALALDQKVLPPTINVTQPAEDLRLEESLFYINNQARPWFSRTDQQPRRAAVSAFGFGGTNFHLVLEEYPQTQGPGYRLAPTAQIILLTAVTPNAMQEQIQELIHELKSDRAEDTFQRLCSESRQKNPPADQPRVGFVARSAAETAAYLQTAAELLNKDPDSRGWNHPRGITYRSQSLDEQAKIAALFPGQGSQYLHMLREAVINFPPLREVIEAMDLLFAEAGQTPLSEVLYPAPAYTEDSLVDQKKSLRETDYAQAAIGVISCGLYQLLQQAGFQPDFTAGHSFGELTALWASSVLDDSAFLRLVKARGEAMRPPENPDFDAGAMAAVKAPYASIAAEISNFPDLVIANENSPDQMVLAGPSDSMTRAEDHFSSQGIKFTRLPVSAAFHTPLVEHASHPFSTAVAQEDFHPAKIPVFSNTTGKPYPETKTAVREILSQHILHPVIFKTQIEALYQSGVRVFVEVGPRQVLGNLVRDILGDRPHDAVSLNPSREKSPDLQLRQAVARLRVIGLPLNAFDPYSATTAPDPGIHIKAA